MATLTLQPDATAGKDSWIQSDDTGANQGTSVQLQAIMTGGGNPRRTVLEFDISSIPASAPVTSATLTLWAETVVGSTVDLNIHRLTQSWTEAGVTWNSRNGTNNWTSAGGDYDATADATFQQPGTIDTSVDVDITSLVQEWVNGTANNGMIIKVATESGTSSGGIFHSSDATGGDASYRPKLVVVYGSSDDNPIMLGANF